MLDSTMAIEMHHQHIPIMNWQEAIQQQWAPLSLWLFFLEKYLLELLNLSQEANLFWLILLFQQQPVEVLDSSTHFA